MRRRIGKDASLKKNIYMFLLQGAVFRKKQSSWAAVARVEGLSRTRHVAMVGP
jgi:hypothetical protein